MDQEIIDGIILLATMLLGYFTRWIQGKKKEKFLEDVIKYKEERIDALRDQKQFIKDNINTKPQ